MRRATFALLSLSLLLPQAGATDFSDYSVSFHGCGSVDGGALRLEVCSGCGDLSYARLTAPLPGTFTFDMHYELQGAQWVDLDITTASGTSSLDTSLSCPPCAGTTSGIAIDVEASDIVTFQLYLSEFICGGPIEVTFSNLRFFPATGVSTLGGALDASSLLDVDAEFWPSPTAVEGVVMLDDVDGDGRGDLACGMPGISSPIKTGRVQVWSGATGAVLHEWLGTTASAHLGRSLGNAGDVDGDGFDDVVATQESPAAVRVFSAATGAELFTINPSASGLSAVDGAGDVDGDGRGDLLVGLSGADLPGLTNCGKVQVYSGATQSLLHEAAGDFAQDELGGVVSRAGDVDGDGYADYLATSTEHPQQTGKGLVRVYSGLTGLPLHSFVGQSNGEELGRRADAAGDFDGDGADDVVAAGNFTQAGDIVRVYSGASGAVLFSASGVLPGEVLGWELSGAGDLDGNGFDDVLASSGFISDENSIRAYGGPTGTVLFELHPLDFTKYLTEDAGRDLDGDGTPDFVVDATDIFGDRHLFVRSGVPGSNAAPALGATDTLLPGSALTVTLTGGPPGGSALFVVGLETLYLPFKGGVMLPVPLTIVPVPLQPNGSLQLGTTWPASFVAGFKLVLQAWMPEPEALTGFVASNGLMLAPPP